jgi:FkbM family methyltransferase
MPSLSRILRLEFNSKLLRSLLSLYYRPGKLYTIPVGHLRGLKIWYNRTVNYHEVLGLYERRNLNILKKIVDRLTQDKPSLNVFDIGANIGMFSLFFTKYKTFQIVAFEAAPETVDMLQKNLSANNAKVVVVPKAVSSQDGEVEFFLTHHHKSSLLHSWASEQGTTEVQRISIPAVSIDGFVNENSTLAPDIIKIDVEGAGAGVLSGGEQIISIRRPLILFESHSADEDNSVIELLRKFQYKAYRTTNEKWVLKETANYTDRDGVWGTMMLIPREKVSMFQGIV